MNTGRIKGVWTWGQRRKGAPLIAAASARFLDVRGLEHVASADHDRPIVLVANHRSYFDMYVVSSVLFRRAPGGLRPRALYFPVRGRYCYASPLGMLLNACPGFWAMYPPFFRTPGTQDFDRYALELLVGLARSGPGTIIGFHPEGHRHIVDDPYAFLPAQPGIGRLIKDARPQVIPVFVAGLDNSLLRQLAANWRPGSRVRVAFGPPIDFGAFYDLPDRARTYKAIADHCMEQIAALAQEMRGER
jgi:1-acyl-sn-glycerol-3-phosphate acyltransferase